MERWQGLVKVGTKWGSGRGRQARKFHQSMRKYERDILRKAMYNVALARAMVFNAEEADRTDRFRISPVGVVEKKAKVRVA